MKKILILSYYHQFLKITSYMEHINSFKKYSKNKVYNLNTELGFPKKLKDIKFDIIVLHYSLFGNWLFNALKNLRRGIAYEIDRKFLEYIKNSKAQKVAFCQDEYRFCQKRFNFLNDYKIDVVYSLLDPKYYDSTYYKYSNVKKVYHTLTGYVDSTLIENSNKLYIPHEKRTLDISYRARELPYYLGKGAQEKVDIAKEFIKRLEGSDLQIDINYTEASRLYGDAWSQMLANSKTVIGVEGGASIFDIDGKAFEVYSSALSENPRITKESIFALLEPWEEKIIYRTIGPRIFEAAAFKVCQVLFEGEYQGILKPMVHYIPLKKDFSNFKEVMDMIKNNELVGRIVNNAYEDLIMSNKYSYGKFIENFENNFSNEQNIDLVFNVNEINEMLMKDYKIRYLIAKIKSLRYKQFIGRKYLGKLIKYVK